MASGILGRYTWVIDRLEWSHPDDSERVLLTARTKSVPLQPDVFYYSITFTREGPNAPYEVLEMKPERDCSQGGPKGEETPDAPTPCRPRKLLWHCPPCRTPARLL